MASQNIWSLDESAKRSQKRRAQTTISMLKPSPNDVVLDIGCSEGYVTSNLLDAGFIVGLDTSRDALLVAAKHVRHPNVSFVYADAGFLPFRDAFFTKITLLEVLEHLPVPKQKTVCQQADRVLREDGTLVVSVPYKEKITYTRCVHCGELTPLWGHLESMDEQKVVSALPKTYVRSGCYNLINLSYLSLSTVFTKLPFRLWLALNNLFGRVSKGYWVMLSFKKK